MHAHSLGMLPAALLSACATAGPVSPTPDVALGEAFNLRVGESARVDSALEVGFDGVLADSRCPEDVACVTGGDATVVVVVGPAFGDGPSRHYELHTGPDNPRREVEIVGSRRLVLLALEPRPKSTVTPQPGDYRVRLRVDLRPAQ